MIVAGEPSTGPFRDRDIVGRVPAPPGIVMLPPPEVPRNAEGAQRESRAKDGVPKSAARDSIKAVAP